MMNRNFVDVPRLMPPAQPSLLSSLRTNLRDFFFPEKLPPLKVTSRPVQVRSIWEQQNPKRAAGLSLLAHGLLIGGIIAATFLGGRIVKEVQNQEHVTLIEPDISQYIPMTAPAKQTMGGGGGGGERAKIEAPKGKLPKQAVEQITPPTVVVRNEQPKLPVEPTVVVPPTVKLPSSNIPTIGDPISKVVGPASNGVGSGSGIGAGSGGGVGIGTGRGVGPGSGAGFGGGVFKIGGGVQAPRALYAPDPEYSEEARKAKYQGTVVLWLIVGPDGHPRDVRIARSLGMGLDEKAIEAVKKWKFEPATKDGRPVAVEMNVEVGFHLY
jgi:protein TonB